MPPRLIVAATRRLPHVCEDELARAYEFRTGDDAAIYTPERLAKQAQGAAALIVSPAEAVNADAIAKLPASVKILATFSVGTDHIDLKTARAKGIVVANTPGVLTDATADIAMLLILGAMRRGSEGERLLRAREWIGWRPTQLMGAQLRGKTLGIVGMGRIGLAVAQRAKAFGMNILYHNRKPTPDAAAIGATFVTALDDMLPQTHVLSLHAPMSADTKGSINARTLALLPKGAFVINTARGGHIVDDDLIAALRSGHIAAAGLDVYNNEPHLDERYRSLENVVLLPHLGSATTETREAMGLLVIKNINAVLAGQAPPHPVEPA